MRIFACLLFAALLLPQLALAGDDLVSVRASNDVEATTDRLEKILGEKGMTVFNRINHAKGAKSVDKELRPTELLIFGKPQVGTTLMQCAQTAGLDLPLKALIWQDEAGAVWITYNNPDYLAKRHNAGECSGITKKMAKALSGMVGAAAK